MTPLRLVLLPGMDGTGDMFGPLLKALPFSMQAEVVSYPSDQAMSYGELEQFIHSRLPDTPFVLLGESFSGPLAITIAARQPAGLCGVILCCTFAKNPRPALAVFGRLFDTWALRQIPPYRLTRFAQPVLFGHFSNNTLLSLLKYALQQVTSDVMVKRTQEVLRINVLNKLASIAVPVMYLKATHDRVIPQMASDLIARELPALKIVSINGPHCLLQASPELSVQAIERFCDRLAA